MNKNVERVFNLLRDTNAWIRIKNIAARLDFEKIGTATGCIVALMKMGMAIEQEQELLDGTVFKFFHIASWCRHMEFEEAYIEYCCGYKNVLPDIVTMLEESVFKGGVK